MGPNSIFVDWVPGDILSSAKLNQMKNSVVLGAGDTMTGTLITTGTNNVAFQHLRTGGAYASFGYDLPSSRVRFVSWSGAAYSEYFFEGGAINANGGFSGNPNFSGAPTIQSVPIARAGLRTDWSTVGTIANVVGQLGWKRFGNTHTIFDASAGTAPDGTTVSNTNPGANWSTDLPVLMGWNGSQTFGVRVDSARNTDSLGGQLPAFYLSSSVASSTYFTIAGAASKADLAGNPNFTGAPTITGNQIWHAGNFSPALKADASSLAAYLTTAAASSTYFTIAGAASKADLAGNPNFTGLPTIQTRPVPRVAATFALSQVGITVAGNSQTIRTFTLPLSNAANRALNLKNLSTNIGADIILNSWQWNAGTATFQIVLRNVSATTYTTVELYLDGAILEW